MYLKLTFYQSFISALKNLQYRFIVIIWFKLIKFKNFRMIIHEKE